MLCTEVLGSRAGSRRGQYRGACQTGSACPSGLADGSRLLSLLQRGRGHGRLRSIGFLMRPADLGTGSSLPVAMRAGAGRICRRLSAVFSSSAWSTAGEQTKGCASRWHGAP